MKVLKFGGASVKNAENILKTIQIVRKSLEKTQVVVVVSAFEGITNKLVEAANQAKAGNTVYAEIIKEITTTHNNTIDILLQGERKEKNKLYVENLLQNLSNLLHGISLIKELSARSLDIISSYGERLSAHIIADAMCEQGISASYLDARTVIKTDKTFGSAKVNFEKTDANIRACYKNASSTFIATGFIASTDDDETITLGRGGSDYSAAIFAHALDAEIIEIWTDVDGMMTADPRKVKKAFPITHVSYAEAMELSHFGAKVLEPRTVIPAMAKGIPVIIKNTFNPVAPGTYISQKNQNPEHRVQGISSIDEISLVTVQGSGMIGEAGISMRLFKAIAKEQINVILITQGSSEHSITFAILPQDAQKAESLLQEEFETEIKTGLIEAVRVQHNMSVIAAVGENMKNIPGVSGRFFNALGINGINIHAIAQGASELNISVVVSTTNKNKALNALHEAFFLSNTQTLNVFIVGTGVIGGELIQQIAAQHQTLIEQNNIDVKVVGISNIDGYLIQEDGIELSNWEATVKKYGKKPDLNDFVETIKALNLRNSVFVDNTGSYDVASKYEELLEKSVSVVTPNKIANASDYERYKKIHAIAANTGARFLYETNVGAGLPVISTLKDLIKSGDEILKIEAIVSGSLNYIFSNCSEQKDFASTVKEAREKGYTEPDPKLDLAGQDVARKILILSREIGCTFNLSDVAIENCLSPQSQKTQSIEELWQTLETYDNPIYKERIQKAHSEGKRLKYIATYENGKAKTEIRAIDANHPFYAISGSDNIISFTTARYRTQPLIVIGPGAGAAVTAAGVFADIIRIANF
ncbi:MAG: bifunctional aspartate kinase/homoserine dehydrogenase I [Bacteroidales bacterium]|nr:bifunctional aspartate kinase/homoserine dehydrogenase I [Bacteroidales bacterium]NLK82395.1 bifunctional aspartate kinase/homoserine dehydrogenase I [Bacteroidales bacterium]HPY81969.1 bifunctional aspartate kinase/homoserine dehydrogenase I [Bacteroidales bacterium]